MKKKGKYIIRIIFTLFLMSISFIAAYLVMMYTSLISIDNNLNELINKESLEIKSELDDRFNKLNSIAFLYNEGLSTEEMITKYILDGSFSKIEFVSGKYRNCIDDENLYVYVDENITLIGSYQFNEININNGDLYIYNSLECINSNTDIKPYLDLIELETKKENLDEQFGIWQLDELYVVNKVLDEEKEIYVLYVTSFDNALQTLDDLHVNNIKNLAIILEIIIIFVSLLYWFMMIKHDLYISKIANRDSLTGLLKLSKFKSKLSYRMKNKKYKYIICTIDVIKFRYINETRGREFGDKILISIANLLKGLGHKSISARSNDVFYLAIHGIDEAKLEKIFNNITTSLNNEYANLDITLTLDCGIYKVQVDDNDVNLIVDRADITRKLNKQDGSSHFCLYDSNIDEEIKRRNELLEIAPQALTNKEFKVYLQPKAILASSGLEYYGSEALVRWNHNDKMISPGEFIPLFEETGFIVDLDYYMFEEVCRNIAHFKTHDIDHKVISINFSRLHLSNKDFVDNLNKIASKYKVEKKYLEIEILEGLMADNYSVFQKTCEKLNKNGYRIAIDDFGSGYSSLNALKNIKCDVVKIDKGFFIDENPTNKKRTPKKEELEKYKKKEKNILSGIVNIIADSNMDLVFEGVENLEILSFLSKLKKDYYQKHKGTTVDFAIQGYFYSKPISVHDYEVFMLKNPNRNISFKNNQTLIDNKNSENEEKKIKSKNNDEDKK